MKKLRTILAALATLRRVPSYSIATAWSIIKEATHDADNVTDADIELIDQIVGAVVSLAKDDEDKAATPGKDSKTAT